MAKLEIVGASQLACVGHAFQSSLPPWVKCPVKVYQKSSVKAGWVTPNYGIAQVKK